MTHSSDQNRPDTPETPDSRLSMVFSDVIDAMDIALWELDRNYRVVAMNRKARKIYGEAALGKCCYQAAAKLSEICPDCPAKLVYDGHESGRSRHRRIDASGNTIYIDHIATPIRDAGGRLTGVLVLIIDITRQREMEIELTMHRNQLEELVTARTDALKESENRYRQLYKDAKWNEELYRSVLNSSADAIVVYDMEGMALYINPAFTRIFGWERREILGRRIPFLPESEREASMAIIRDLIDNGIPCQGFITQRYNKAGQLLDISLSASRYHDHLGNPAGMLVILRDISEWKRMEVQLKHSERMEAIGTLAGGIAHDFNNLLMGIMGNVSIMIHELNSGHPHLNRLKTIEKLVQSGSRLTSQLLGYARKGLYEVRTLDLNRVIRDAIETFSRTRKDIHIELDLADDLCAVDADESQMEQVLWNLCVNAFDAMPRGGRLTIGTRNVNSGVLDASLTEKPGACAMIQVADTGTGIDQRVIGRIFDPFFTTKELGQGTGLGLASVYGIVQSHGGRIAVDSTLEVGTTFKVYLPASKEGVDTAAESAAPLKSGNALILLVDDEELILDVGAQMLKLMGHQVLTADTSEKAISLYRENADRVDLVILDMILPDTNGSHTFDAIKGINPNARVLLASGYSIEGQAREILSRGCNGFIQKPFHVEEFSRKIDEILR